MNQTNAADIENGMWQYLSEFLPSLFLFHAAVYNEEIKQFTCTLQSHIEIFSLIHTNTNIKETVHHTYLCIFQISVLFSLPTAINLWLRKQTVANRGTVLQCVSVTVTISHFQLLAASNGGLHFITENITISDEIAVLVTVTVTVTVTKVFILRFLLKDRKRITESFTYIQRSPS